MTLGDIIVIGILALIVGMIFFNIFRKKKEGGHCGCSSCQSCSMAGKCHQK